MTIDGEPGVTVEGGGSIRLIDPNTSVVVLEAAGNAPFQDGSGRVQASFTLRRASDGTVALDLADDGVIPAHPYAQALQFFDRAGHIWLADDANGMGMARPYVPAYWASLAALTDTTTSSSYVGLEWSDIVQQHPQVRAAVICQTPAGTVGSIRLTVGGVQIGSAVTVPSATFATMVIGPAPWPDGTWIHESFQTVQLEGKVTSGAGALGVRGLSLWGVQT
jgi:hypothetical protein